MSVRAWVFCKVEAGHVPGVCAALRQIRSVERADVITGPFDVIAHVGGPTVADVGQLVQQEIGNIPGITKTTTCIVVNPRD